MCVFSFFLLSEGKGTPDFSSLTDGVHKNVMAALSDVLIFTFKASPYSPTVIVSAGGDGNTQKIQFVCDEHPHPPETKGTVTYEKLIILYPNKDHIMRQRSHPEKLPVKYESHCSSFYSTHQCFDGEIFRIIQLE